MKRSLPIALLFSLSACMQAEKISLDTSGLEGLLLGSISFNASDGSTSGGGSTGMAPVMLDANPEAADGVVYINVHFSGLYFDFDTSLRTTDTPTVKVAFWNGSVWEEPSNLNITTSISGSRLTVQTGLVFFPENTRVRVTVVGSTLHSADGLAGTQDFTTEFLTNKIGPRVITTGSGRFQSATLSGNDVVIDNATAIRWTKCALGTAADCSGTPQLYSQGQAMGACAALNSMNSGAGYAGRTNWRLPSIEELESLPDFERTQPLLPSANFPNLTSGQYWSMSAVGPTSTLAWSMNLYTGEQSQTGRATALPVRCLSDEGGNVPYSSGSNTSGAGYGVNEDGLNIAYYKLDLFPTYYFTPCVLGFSSVYTGTYLCQTPQTIAGVHSERVAACAAVSGRRAPTIDELLLILRRELSATGYRALDFYGAGGDSIVWSSTTAAGSKAYAVDFQTGAIKLLPQAESHAIRCLRTAAPF
ncbi:MAG: hypothetical protein CVV45_00530 [Spirochaetae bacterium HGW-Spirochaetae-10]|jgi:hypothetical protein|nr:MAG: hypothetical protein CVV45_00530 [Spirochaetae bacterium HGW-Spirochaetae-10]